MENDYKPNSHRSKEQSQLPERRVESVVTSPAQRRHPSSTQKLLKMLLPGDVEDVKHYILMDVLIPNVKRTILDGIINCVNMMFGDGPNQNRSSNPVAKVSYRSCYTPQQNNRPRPQSVYTYDEIIFATRGDAEAVLYQMNEIIEKFQVVSVADLFDLAQLSHDFTCNKYGWTDLRGAYAERVRDGFVLRLPTATSLQ